VRQEDGAKSAFRSERGAARQNVQKRVVIPRENSEGKRKGGGNLSFKVGAAHCRHGGSGHGRLIREGVLEKTMEKLAVDWGGYEGGMRESSYRGWGGEIPTKSIKKDAAE